LITSCIRKAGHAVPGKNSTVLDSHSSSSEALSHKCLALAFDASSSLQFTSLACSQTDVTVKLPVDSHADWYVIALEDPTECNFQ
jgi:hypothetical protein